MQTQTAEQFHQFIAAQLDAFHSQRLAGHDADFGVVAENAALHAQLGKAVPEPSGTIHHDDAWSNGTGIHATFDEAAIEIQETEGRALRPSVCSTTTFEQGITCAANIREECCITTLDFLDPVTAEVKHHNTITERYCPVYPRIRNWFSRNLPPPLTGSLYSFVDGSYFKFISAVVITLNYFFIVAQSNYLMTTHEESDLFTAFGYGFNGFYVFELLAQIFVYRKDFFMGHEAGWNMFDTGIVSVAVVEVVVKLTGAAFVNTSFLRIFRFLKVSRVLRMFSAMRAFKEIKILVDTLVGSLSLFIWCCVFFALFLSLMGIFFVQGAAAYLGDDPDHPDSEFVHQYFGSVSAGMMALFMSSTGGTDWQEVHEVANMMGVVYGHLFIFYNLFYSVAFNNVMTSVFCEKALRIAKPETFELIQRRHDIEVKDSKELLHLMRTSMEDDGSCCISRENFDRFVAHPEVELYFEVRGLRTASAHRFFATLCELNQTDKVDYASFISAIVKLDGTASSIDVHCLNVRQLHCAQQLQAAANAQHLALQREHAYTNDRISQVMACIARLSARGPSAVCPQTLGNDPLLQDKTDTSAAFSL